MIDTIEETEEEREAREKAAQLLLDTRTTKALAGAADIAMHVRSLAVNGKTERGETLPEWTAPMRITAVDDLDEVYAQIINWVSYWSETLAIAPPSTAVVAWSNFKEVQGFRAGTTPEGAAFLMRLQTMWLGVHAPRIREDESGNAFQENIVELLGALRGRYPMSPRPPRQVSARPCRVCGEHAVEAWWPGDDTFDVAIECAVCGEEYSTDPKSIIRWLPQESQIELDKLQAAADAEQRERDRRSQDSQTGATR